MRITPLQTGLLADGNLRNAVVRLANDGGIRVVDVGGEDAGCTLEDPVDFSDRLIGRRILEPELAHGEINRVLGQCRALDARAPKEANVGQVSGSRLAGELPRRIDVREVHRRDLEVTLTANAVARREDRDGSVSCAEIDDSGARRQSVEDTVPLVAHDTVIVVRETAMEGRDGAALPVAGPLRRAPAVLHPVFTPSKVSNQ